MYFSDEAIEQLRQQYQTLDQRFDALFVAYTQREFISPHAKEYAREGFLRRLSVMRHALTRVFELLPPDEDDVPGINARTDVLVNLHAFVINVFGAIDNLAWIWVEEKKIRKTDGSTLGHFYVGLGPKNTVVRASLSPPFRDHLRDLKAWFKYLENFRNALAHRIPLYIPPHGILEKDEARYQELLAQKYAARGNPSEFNRLSQELDALKRFVPVAQHSFGDSRPFPFHPQILSDFAVVEQLGHMMLNELDRDVPTVTPMPKWRKWLLWMRLELCALCAKQ